MSEKLDDGAWIDEDGVRHELTDADRQTVMRQFATRLTRDLNSALEFADYGAQPWAHAIATELALARLGVSAALIAKRRGLSLDQAEEIVLRAMARAFSQRPEDCS